MRTLIGVLLIGIVAVILGGIFFVTRPVMAIVRGMIVSPTAPITQTTPVYPNPLPNAQYQDLGMDDSDWSMNKNN